MHMTAQPLAHREPSPIPAVADSASAIAQTVTRRTGWAFAATLLTIEMLLLVAMPRWLYPGDNHSTRAEAINLVARGELGIAYANRAELGEFLANRGQYFFENDARQHFFPKYGLAYTLIYLPPVAVESRLSTDMELLQDSPSLLLLLNLYNLVFVAVIVTYLWRLARCYTDDWRILSAFVFASVFCTHLAYYVRAHAHDIFQIAAFLGFAYHSLVFLRQRSISGPVPARPRVWLHLLAANCWLGLLIHMRFSYGVLYLPLCAFVLLAGPSSLPPLERVWQNLKVDRWRYALALCAPAAASIGTLLLIQWWKFGNPLDHGYAQWELPGERGWRLAHLGGQLHRYFVGRGNANIWVYYPVLLFAILGMPYCLRKYRLESGFVLAISACILLPLLGMPDEGYGYGPRYMLPALAVLSLPFVVAARRTVSRAPLMAKVAGLSCFCVVMGWSLVMQLYVNSTHFFAYNLVQQQLTAATAGSDVEEDIAAYFRTWHRGTVHRDLVRYRNGDQEFPPVAMALSIAPQNKRATVEEKLRALLDHASAPNSLFVPLLLSGRG